MDGALTASAQPPALRQSQEPPVVPVGLDAYRMWDRLPYHRIGVRAFMRSTYDREGNNRTADASHFLYQEAEDFNVVLDVAGPGVLYFKRSNHWHGSPWHYEVDGEHFIVRETSTADPVNAKARFEKTTFLPENLFPNPLTWTWTTTHGANLMWVPLMFEDSFRIAYSRTFYGTGYFIYHIFPEGIGHLSRPIRSWEREEPDPEVLNLLRRAGTDIAPKDNRTRKWTGAAELQPNQWTLLTEIEQAPATIRALKFTVARDKAFEFGKARLRITWDDRWHPSIDAPIDLLFGAGQLHNDNDREYLVQGFPVNVRYDESQVHLACYWPMPFFKNARIELQDREGASIQNIQWEIRIEPYTDPVNHAAYFHATYSDHPNPVYGQDITFLDTEQVEGSSVWSGNFVGMSWIFSRDGVLNTLEGDPRFFFDDSKTPQGWGTGTEEWGGGGDYWGGRNMTIPFAGHPVGHRKDRAKTDKDLVNSAYRFLIADLFPFGRRAKINLEHGSVNQSVEHYSGVVYWYGVDSPALELTDELNVSNARSIQEHKYESPTAEPPYTLVSRYEWGPDGDVGEWGRNPDIEPRHQFYPAEQDRTRIMTGTTEFEVNLNPENLGVMLRRKFDYQYPNQRAKVSVRPAGGEGEWNEAGVWYTAGSNTCVFSNPRPAEDSGIHRELAPSDPRVIMGNRRWREEEFLIARQFTEGVERLQIRIEHIPVDRKLLPDTPFPVESAWSESRYWVYCYRMPEATL